MLRSLRNFIVSLLVSGLVFGFAAYYLSGVLIECLGPLFGVSAENHLKPQEEIEKEKEEEETAIPEIEVESSFSILLITTNYKPSQSSEYNAYDVKRYPKNENEENESDNDSTKKRIEAVDFVLLRGNSKRKEFTYTYLPATLQANVKGRTLSLSRIYRDFGVTTLTRKVSALTGFDIDSYAIYDLEDVSYIVDYIEGVTYNVPTDIKDGDNVILSKGNKKISGNNAIKLFEYQDYASTSQRGQMTLSFVKAMMTKITNKASKIDVGALHRSAQSKVDTTMTLDAVSTISALLYNYSLSNIADLSYPGTYKKIDEETVFIPNVTAAVNNFSIYR